LEKHDKASWPYVKRKQRGTPVLGMEVVGPLRQAQPETLIPIDTGYEGFLLLGEDRYTELGLNLAELPRRYWPEAETVTGEVFRLRRALAMVQIPKAGIELEGYIDTFRGNTEDLVGLTLLDTLKLLLEGPKQLTCLL